MKKKFFVVLISIVSVIALGIAGCNLSPRDNIDNTDTSDIEIVTPKPDDTDKDKPNNPPVEDTKEFDEAVKKVGDFIEKMKTSQNFTLSQKSANGEPIVIKFDREACEVTADNVTTYYSPMQDGKLYKIAKDSEDKWRKDECESAPYAVSDKLTVFESTEWEIYEDTKLTGKTIYNGQKAVILVKLSNGTCDYTLTYSSNTNTGSISYVESTSVNLPEIEEEKSEDPIIDYDNLTEEQIKALTPIMVENIKTTLQTNIQKNIGNSGVINNIFAIDFDGNNLILGINFTNNSYGQQFGVFSYALNSEANYKSLAENNFQPTTNKMGTELIYFVYINNNKKTDAVFNKLYQDNVIEENGEYDLQDLKDLGTAVNENHIEIYRINSTEVINVSLQVRSDGNTKDYITDNLINGELNGTRGYRVNEIKIYKFTDNALYNFNGLEKAS